jgi:hypothetical protein
MGFHVDKMYGRSVLLVRDEWQNQLYVSLMTTLMGGVNKFILFVGSSLKSQPKSYLNFYSGRAGSLRLEVKNL